MSIRGLDGFGHGEVDADRKDKDGKVYKHQGIDLLAEIDQPILSRTDGVVTQNRGIVYDDTDFYRYVEVKSEDGARHRYFYVTKGPKPGTKVTRGEIIGSTQDIGVRYNTATQRIQNHIHYEIMIGKKKVNPREYWNKPK